MGLDDSRNSSLYPHQSRWLLRLLLGEWSCMLRQTQNKTKTEGRRRLLILCLRCLIGLCPLAPCPIPAMDEQSRGSAEAKQCHSQRAYTHSGHCHLPLLEALSEAEVLRLIQGLTMDAEAEWDQLVHIFEEFHDELDPSRRKRKARTKRQKQHKRHKKQQRKFGPDSGAITTEQQPGLEAEDLSCHADSQNECPHNHNQHPGTTQVATHT